MNAPNIAIGSKRRLESVHWTTEHRSGQTCTVVNVTPSDNFKGRFRYTVEFADGKIAVASEGQLKRVIP